MQSQHRSKRRNQTMGRLSLSMIGSMLACMLILAGVDRTAAAVDAVAEVRVVEQTPAAPESPTLHQTARGLAKSGWSSIKEVGNTQLTRIGRSKVTLFGMIKMGLILLLAYALSWLLRRTIRRVQRSSNAANQSAFYTLERILHYAVLVIGLMIAMGSIGIDLSKLTLFVSAMGVGLGFGMQAIISNFVSGLIILFERHLKIGDFVELESGVTGEVREINIRATRITTNDNIDVLVPNSEFVNGRVVNWTLEDISRRLRVKFGVSYSTDKGSVREAVLQAALTVPFTRTDSTHRPQVWLIGFGDSSLDFELVVWLSPEAVKRPSTVHAAYCWAIDDALRSAGIEIPFPQRDLHVRSLFGLEAQAAQRFVRGIPESELQTGPEPAVAASANDALEEAVRLARSESQSAPPSAAEPGNEEKPR